MPKASVSIMEVETTKHTLDQLRRLNSEFMRLVTFPEVAAWAVRAQELYSKAFAITQQLEDEILDISFELEKENDIHRAKKLLSRILDRRQQRKELLSRQTDLRAYLFSILYAADHLDANLALSPKDPVEQNSLIEELRQYRIFLKIQQRNLGKVRRPITPGADPRGSKTIPERHLLPSLLRSRELRAHLNQEAALSLRENIHTAIDRQLKLVDQYTRLVDRIEEETVQ